MENSTFKKDLGARIRKERLHYDIKQNELAKMLGKGTSVVSSYESGDVLPPTDIICQLADIFNCSSDYLLCRTDSKNSHTLTLTVGEMQVKIEYEGDTPPSIDDILKSLDKTPKGAN